eukprot:14198291-Alexandrium_andersonii.AAC.1
MSVREASATKDRSKPQQKSSKNSTASLNKSYFATAASHSDRTHGPPQGSTTSGQALAASQTMTLHGSSAT